MKTIALLFFLASSASANDASFFGDGATVFAIKDDRVRMAAEKIVIRYDGSKPFREQWGADCLFSFFNESDKDADVQMGFPDWRAWGDTDHETWTISSFTATVDGKPVSVSWKKIANPKDTPPALTRGVKLEYDAAYLWKARIEPKGTIQVRNTFRFGGFSSNGPASDFYKDMPDDMFWLKAKNTLVGGFDFGDGLYEQVRYIVTTGKTWAGPIGEADISIQLPEKALPHELVPMPPATEFGSGFVRWRKKDWTPDRELSLSRVRPGAKDDAAYARGPLFSSLDQVEAWLSFLKANGGRRDLMALMADAYRYRNGLPLKDASNAPRLAKTEWFKPPLTPAPLSKSELAIAARLDAAAALPAARSVYTDVGDKSCKTIEQAAAPEGAWTIARCPGAGGMQLDLIDDDERQSARIVDGSRTHDLNFFNNVTPHFNFLGPKAEWRLAGEEPIAMIIRMRIQQEDLKAREVLIVSKVSPEAACAVKIVEASSGEKANEEARIAADEARDLPCLWIPSAAPH